MQIIKGVWLAGKFEYSTTKLEFLDAMDNMQRFVTSIVNLLAQTTGDTPERIRWMTQQLEIESSITDFDDLERAYYDILYIDYYHVTRRQYMAYMYMLSLFRHLLLNGEVLWDNRTVLLDISTASDWMIDSALVKR